MAHYAKSLTRFSSAVLSAASVAATSLFFLPTSDALATVLADGYLNDSRAQLNAGDIVFVASAEGGTVDWAVLKVTASPSSGNVTTAIASGLKAITDNSGGAASDTIAAITAGAAYDQADMTAIKNAIATLAARINAIAG